MTNLDQADEPAKNSEYRGLNPKTRDVIFLERPDFIKYHPDYNLQKRDEYGNWVAATVPSEDAPSEDQSNPS